MVTPGDQFSLVWIRRKPLKEQSDNIFSEIFRQMLVITINDVILKLSCRG